MYSGRPDWYRDKDMLIQLMVMLTQLKVTLIIPVADYAGIRIGQRIV